jgi:hypothetical protein
LDKDCELQKIGAFRSYLDADVNAKISFLAGGLIGILILVITLFYEGVFDVFGGRLVGIAPFAVVLAAIFYAFSRILQSIKDQQTRHLSLIFDLISKVEKGEPLPPLSELEKEAAPKNKP